MFLSDACQPEVDFRHSWAVVLPKRSGELSADLLPPGILKGKKALVLRYQKPIRGFWRYSKTPFLKPPRDRQSGRNFQSKSANHSIY